ncbi:uncharacterized protein LOC110814423 [Carica papaya]|uniref:uncharacterized protein LOC110814423 n=1 Tax=Carica papaya TaxID=3649 RepID=UPI000B8CB2F3|nr:uncharacterized protein LOC110814423 [Carica papaya]
MALLGDDGKGYELARKLESCGVWRAWLGDSLYSGFAHFLSSSSSWESFMRVDDSKSRAQIQLQLRARALLFDKATVSLFLRSNHNPNPSTSSSFSASCSLAVSRLNNNYLRLHGDDVYFTLENGPLNGVQQREGGLQSNTTSSKVQSRSTFSSGPRYDESEFDNLSQRYRTNELPETWYNQFIEHYRVSRPYRLSHGDRESDKRTPEDMSAYLRHVEKHKRRRIAFQEDQSGFGNSVLENRSGTQPSSTLDGNNSDDDVPFLPETMFTMNCVPDSALPSITRAQDNRKVEFYGVLDTLPQVTTKSPVMIERLGIMPEYLSMEQRGSLRRGKTDRRSLSEEQALQMSQKVMVRMLNSAGFESTTEVPLEVLSQLLSHHLCKLGRILKVLTDSYRKQCSAIELLKMFLQTAGYSNFGVLADLVKDNTSIFSQQAHQQANAIQSAMQSQHQNPLRLAQQMPRQMHPQMQQMVQLPTLTMQQRQQLERFCRRQASASHPAMDIDKDRPLVQVKLEASELPLDGNAFNAINNSHQQMQFQQQQIAVMSNLHAAQSSSQFRQLASMQIPQMQTQNMSIVRAPPVKVEGFQELMGGDHSLKHDSEENKLASSSGK